VRLYLQVKTATVSWGDTLIVYHNRATQPDQRLHEYNTYEFTDSVLHELGYIPVSNTLVPGSNHFPILKFYLDNPDYDYYWCIEDDIVFNGEWFSFFYQIINQPAYDFISCYVKYKKDKINPDWYWWDSLSKANTTINENDLAMSFNPIYCLSKAAADFLDKSLKAGWTGHHEVLIATLLTLNKFKVKDFGGKGKFVPSGFGNKFYTGLTHKWRPPFEAPGKLLNKIYHPVKNQFKITANFKFRISFCLIINNNWERFEQTLFENIQDSVAYENFEFVILDFNSSRKTKAWFKENVNNLINKGEIAYYKLSQTRAFNRSHATNLICKLASGDIICLIEAGQLIGKDFCNYINGWFKINSNIMIVSPSAEPNNANFTTYYERIMAVKKVDFLHVKGFDEKTKTTVFEDTDLIRRLELSRIEKITKNDTDLVPQWSAEKLSLDYVYLTLDKILVQHIDPSQSRIIFMYNTGVFEMSILTNNITRGSDDFKYSYRKRRIKSKFQTSSWISGRWHFAHDNETLVLNPMKGKKISLYPKEWFYETALKGKKVEFYNINTRDDKKELINLHYQSKNQQLFKENAHKKNIYLNSSGFGKGAVYKNFCSDLPIIIN